MYQPVRSDAGRTYVTAAVARREDVMGARENQLTEDEVVRAHMPLVGHIVREFLLRLPAHVNRDDLVSAGMMALAMSAKHFDASRGVPFARFAAIRIRGSITDELRSLDWASRGVRTRSREVELTRTRLTNELGRVPTRDELATGAGVSISDLDQLDNDVHRASTLSLHALAPGQADDIIPASNDQGPEGLLLKREQIGYLRDAIAELPERLRTVVAQYFFEQRKMSEIAADLGVTESRVSQLRSQALTMLRTGLRSQDDEFAGATSAEAETKSARRTGTDAAYCAALAARSSLASRLEATNAYGEMRHRVALGSAQRRVRD
jgi:RNA polymerase sigma factor for flagellar operon FliA